MSIRQRSLQRNERPPAGRLPKAQCRRKRTGQVAGFGDGDQRDPDHTVAEPAPRVDARQSRELDGQPGLPRTTDATDRHQPGGADQFSQP